MRAADAGFFEKMTHDSGDTWKRTACAVSGLNRTVDLTAARAQSAGHPKTLLAQTKFLDQ